MKKRCLSITLIFSFAQVSCGIGGHTMTGMVLEKDLKAIKPLLQYYEKPSWTVEGRRSDSKTCGGPPNESIQFGSNAIKTAQRPGESDRETETRLRQEWRACMKEKGYQDIRARSQQQ